MAVRFMICTQSIELLCYYELLIGLLEFQPRKLYWKQVNYSRHFSHFPPVKKFKKLYDQRICLEVVNTYNKIIYIIVVYRLLGQYQVSLIQKREYLRSIILVTSNFKE